MMRAEMTAGTNQCAAEDYTAVAAVRAGDVERYRELVERHERRVFAVAWSRLGDATLAEEVTQEAFIRAYRRLWLLGDGAKFAGWVNAIARRAAINFGLRHRRELDKRERWALDNSPVATGDCETEPLYSPETLRQTLAALPAGHRECLVLFYLEGKSGAETAAALGISEAALRVRLHRARTALRDRLEDRLGESLEQLRPSRPLASGVMAGVLKISPGWLGGGMGAKLLSGLAPIKFLGLIFFLGPLLPGVVLNFFTIRMDQRNLRDPQGFRARMGQRRRWGIWIWFAVIAGIQAAVYAAFHLHWAQTNGVFLVCGYILLTISIFMARKVAFSPNRFSISWLVASLIMAAGCLLIGFKQVPSNLFTLFMLPYFLALATGCAMPPTRVDGNLFLRAAQNMLTAEMSASAPARPLNDTQMHQFARFLANRWLVVDHRWRDDGLLLHSPPLTASSGYFGRNQSSVMLQWNGNVTATIGPKDEKYLIGLQAHALPSRAELETQVATAVELAWRQFSAGNLAAAERAVGQVPDADVFVVPPERSPAAQWRKGFFVVAVVIIVALELAYFFQKSRR